MSSSKTTHELEKRLDHLQSLIVDVEADIGNKLFLSKSDVVSQHQEEYASFEEKKSQLCSDIEVIRSLAEKRQLFKNDAESLQQQLDALTTSWPPLYEGLGSAIADSPNALYDKEFDAFREPIAELRRKDNEARVALDNLKDQMANQSFMNRLLTQVQYTARNKAVSQMEKKISQLYVKCGKAIFETGVLTVPFEEGRLPEVVADACGGCRELKVKADQLQEQVNAVRQHLEENAQALSEKGVTSDNPDKRIKAINLEIDQEVQKQRDLCQACGHDFVARYIDPEGELLEEYSEGQEDIASRLQQIVSLKKDKVACSRKVQIISLSNQIDALAKKITSFRTTIADNEEKIASLQSRNRELEDKIAISTSEKEQLVIRRNELELADSQERLEG